jgi:hypothetical protein
MFYETATVDWPNLSNYKVVEIEPIMIQHNNLGIYTNQIDYKV